MQEIADIFGVSRTTIHRWMKKHNIQARDAVEESVKKRKGKPLSDTHKQNLGESMIKTANKNKDQIRERAKISWAKRTDEDKSRFFGNKIQRGPCKLELYLLEYMKGLELSVKHRAIVSNCTVDLYIPDKDICIQVYADKSIASLDHDNMERYVENIECNNIYLSRMSAVINIFHNQFPRNTRLKLLTDELDYLFEVYELGRIYNLTVEELG